MTDLTKLVKDYLQTWNDNDATARRAAIERIWSPAGRYVDPIADVRGPKDIDTLIGAAQPQFGGMALELLGDIDTHHDVARFRWSLGPTGEEIVIGFDVLTSDGNGRITSVVGFFDKAP